MKNKELKFALVNINGTGGFGGLRSERLPMGVRLSLLKIAKELESCFNDYAAIRDDKIKEHYPDFLDELETKRLEEAKDPVFFKMIAELKEFDELDATATFEKLDISKFEDVITDYDYSLLLELICK